MAKTRKSVPVCMPKPKSYTEPITIKREIHNFTNAYAIGHGVHATDKHPSRAKRSHNDKKEIHQYCR